MKNSITSLIKVKNTFVFTLGFLPFCIHAQSAFKVLKSFPIASAGGWDYLAVQPNSKRLFVSHESQVNIIDKNTGDSIGVIANTMGIHGIAFVPALNKGFTTNGKTDNAFVFDLKTLKVTDTIATGKKPDAIFYDNFSKKLIICNGKSNNLTIVEPKTNKVVTTVAVGGKPETAVSNNEGKIFVNLEDKNEVVVVNAITYSVEARWSISPGEAPTGLAIDNVTKRLFVACGDNKLLVVLDANAGKTIQTIPIGEGCDGAAFDAATKLIYTANGDDGTLTIIHEDDADHYSLLANTKTQKSGRTIALDEATHLVYIPVADFEDAQAKGHHHKVKAGSFKILVVGK